MKQLHCRRGLSLLEIVLALALFGLVAGSIAALWLGGVRADFAGSSREIAGRWSEEAVEGARWLAWNNWDALTLNQSGLQRLTNGWSLKGEGTVDVFGGMQRRLLFSQVCRSSLSGPIVECPQGVVDPATKKLRIIVSWTTDNGAMSLEEMAWLVNHRSLSLLKSRLTCL